ncbi:MAG: AtpZ/AtpI family protein [Dehalococcoidia bacterium]|nr:AtpZ/AtpI family protein [Dehalococcoidia bacterium]
MKKPWIVAVRFIGIGWYIGLCIAGGVFLGRWIGQKVGAETFCSLMGLAVGVVVAVYGIWIAYSLLNRNGLANKEDKEK